MSLPLRLGPLQLSLYSLCAAAGMVAGLALSSRTARLARLSPGRVVDAVLAMAFAALLFSRALLVMGSFRSFLAAPLRVLTLPWVNDTGLLLTGLFGVGWLRWKRLPLLPFLDAMAPCVALLSAFLSLGSLLEGTRDGMPTPWLGGTVQPAELYAVLLAMVLCGGLVRALSRGLGPGWVFGGGLALAGAGVFGLDFLRLPSVLFAAAMLDPVQWLGLAMLVVGVSLLLALPDARNGSGRAL